jgi:hypothetical protein
MEHVQKLARLGIALCLMLGMGGLAQATVIDFEDLVGPSTFAAAGDAADYSITIDDYLVVVHGGVILTQATNMPADLTSVYGTANFGGPTDVDPLTVSFFDATTHAPRTISNFFLDVFNGLTVNINYTVSDNLSNSEAFNLMPNLSSGQKTIGFAAAGSTITIFGAPPVGSAAWDFEIDSIHFNEPLNEPLPAPEPGSLALIGIGLAALGFRFRVDQRFLTRFRAAPSASKRTRAHARSHTM